MGSLIISLTLSLGQMVIWKLDRSPEPLEPPLQVELEPDAVHPKVDPIIGLTFAQFNDVICCFGLPVSQVE